MNLNATTTQDEKLNICELNDTFPPAIYGVANVVCNYAKQLSADGAEITVAAPKYRKISNNYPFEVLTYPCFNTLNKIGYKTFAMGRTYL